MSTQTTVNWGTGTIKRGQWKAQVYWPYVRIRIEKTRKYRELAVSADTVFRCVWERGYFGLGFQVLGFGCAVDWLRG